MRVVLTVALMLLGGVHLAATDAAPGATGAPPADDPSWPDDAQLGILLRGASARVEWPLATDALRYEVLLDGRSIALVTTPRAHIDDLLPGITYTIAVRGLWAGGRVLDGTPTASFRTADALPLRDGWPRMDVVARFDGGELDLVAAATRRTGDLPVYGWGESVRLGHDAVLVQAVTVPSASLLASDGVEAVPGAPGWWRARVDAFDAPAVAERLRSVPGVDAAWPETAMYRVPRHVPDDPLFADQWSHANTGQGGGRAGVDGRTALAWDVLGPDGAALSGAGVLIAIVDDGLQYDHPDLEPAYVAGASADRCDGDADPYPEPWDDHGTAVAGIAAARGDDGYGVVGAAPGASLAAHRLIACWASVSDEAAALGADADVSSNSWGPYDDGMTLLGPDAAVRDAIEHAATNGRGGLGTVFTWAAGNGRSSDDDANYDGYANDPRIVAVSAVAEDGSPSWYSETCACLLVAAPSSGNDSGVTTTDLLGEDGYAAGDHTPDFGGTSAAAPFVAGVVALVLEANPALTARDVVAVLATTANADAVVGATWGTNGAGHPVSHDVGFGLVDAEAAVVAAKTWTALGPAVSTSVAGAAMAVPDGFGDWNMLERLRGPGVAQRFEVSDDLDVERVVVTFDATHPAPGDLRLELTSPSGTLAVLLPGRHGSDGSPFDGWSVSATHFLGERSTGLWTLRAFDVYARDVGTLDAVTITLHGAAGGDRDGDGVVEGDVCPLVADADQADADADGAGDACDAFPLDPTETADSDGDTIGDVGDDDDDGDGTPDTDDAFPLDPAETTDSDGDGVGDVADADDDGDGLDDAAEALLGTSPTDADSDDDRLLDPTEVAAGTNPLDADTDDDGSDDADDAFPLDPTEQADSDRDGLGDNLEGVLGTDPLDDDTDDDWLGDGEEVDIGTDPLDADSDDDGLDDFTEWAFGTDPTLPDGDGDGLPDGAELIAADLDLWRDACPYANDADSDADGLPDGTDARPCLPGSPTACFAPVNGTRTCPVTMAWRDVPEDVTLALGDDDVVEVALPFAFPFGGVGRASVNVSSNGYVVFGDAGESAGCCEGERLPSQRVPAPAIFGAWTDLDPSGGGDVAAFVRGEAPRREAVIAFLDVPRFGGDGAATFQIVLREDGDAEIHVVSADTSGFDPATVGWQAHGSGATVRHDAGPVVMSAWRVCSPTSHACDPPRSGGGGGGGRSDGSRTDVPSTAMPPPVVADVPEERPADSGPMAAAASPVAAVADRVEVAFDAAAALVTRLDFLTDADDVVVTVRSTRDAPSGVYAPGRPTLRYLDIAVRRADGTDVAAEDASIEFLLTAADLQGRSTRDVVLLHMDGGAWVALPTTYLGRQDGSHAYRARTPHFSVFAVAVDDVAPSIALVGATYGDVVAPGQLLMFRVSDDLAVAEVVVEVDGDRVEATRRGEDVHVRAPEAPGRHKVVVTAFDAAGHRAFGTWRFDVADRAHVLRAHVPAPAEERPVVVSPAPPEPDASRETPAGSALLAIAVALALVRVHRR